MELGVTAKENKVSLGEEKKSSRIRCSDGGPQQFRGSSLDYRIKHAL